MRTRLVFAWTVTYSNFYIVGFCVQVHIRIKTSLRNLVLFICNIFIEYIKTHGSESRGQEEAGLRDEPVSYLQVALL